MSSTGSELLKITTSYWQSNIRRYSKGRILYWQGDPVEIVYVIKKGVVKISSVSSTGKIYSHGFMGPGHLLGATDFFLDSYHATTAEIVEDGSLVVIPQAEFQSKILIDRTLSSLVMHELAREAKLHLTKAQDLSFLDAQERLKQSLIKLAGEHGLITEGGIEIDLNITHEEMGELINANRTTITLCLQELKKLGYLRTEGRRFILIPVNHIHILDQLSNSVISGFVGEVSDWVDAAIEEGVDLLKILDALRSGMKEVDRRYDRDRLGITDIMWSSTQMKAALSLIESAIQHQQIQQTYLGTIVFGTVKGDIHDIGKNITSMLLKARGFEVRDLGVDVHEERFVEAVQQHKPDILAMSALLTTTQIEMGKVIQALETAGVRDKIKVMIGGAPTTPRFAQEIGADGYGFEGREGAELAWRWCSEK